MESTLNQTVYGKAYEYACLLAIHNLVVDTRPIAVTQNSSLKVAMNAWSQFGQDDQKIMTKSALAGVKALIELEPKITEDGRDQLELALQEDSRGKVGDVRDVLIIRRNISWEIGISVKHNHDAVKHSRLSPTIDFGKEWFDIPCSRQYFDEISPIFAKLNTLKDSGAKWGEVNDKDSEVYVPLLKAFMGEIKRLDSRLPGVVPEKLLEYLLGRNDFYKLISDDTRKSTVLQCFNLHGTLNTPSKQNSPTMKVKKIEMPTKIYHFDFASKNNEPSLTTVQLVLDNNWAITFRIHSAKTEVEASLKFDIRLTGVPSTLFSNTTSW